MNKVMGFIKSNLIIVVSIVLILAFLPAGYVFASRWNAQVRTQAQEAYTAEKRTLSNRGSITYSLPAVLEGEEDLSETRPPNSAVTAYYQRAKAQREEQVEEVVERGTDFNRGDHVELVEGLLPQAENPSARARLGRTMIEAIVGTESTPSVYRRKLQRLNAGSPPDPVALAAELEQARSEQRQVYENANASGSMTEEQAAQLEQDMASRRLGEYIGRARALTFYCSPDSFVNGTGQPVTATSDGYSVIPGTMWPLSRIDEPAVFTWLWDYWIISDVLDAAAMANTSAATGAQAIPEAPVKSIERIRISALNLTEAEAPASADDQFSPRGGRGGGSPTAAEDTNATFTGRTGGGPNSAFDIRTIELTAVVASRDLPAFIDAIGKTNYMTVTDMDISQVDVWADLQAGYYYGDEHVVRVSMEIESVWLRSWLSPLMPDRVKSALGIPVAGAAPQDDEG